MFVKLSSFKRASRSLAKTGLFLDPFGRLFPPLFRVSFWRIHGGSFGPFGLPFWVILEPFGWLLGDFLGIEGIRGNWCPSQAKTYFLRFWGIRFPHFCWCFWAPDSSCLFKHVFDDFHWLLGAPGSPNYSLLGSFGAQFSANKAPCIGLGPRVAPRRPKGSLLSAFLSYFCDIWDGFWPHLKVYSLRNSSCVLRVPWWIYWIDSLSVPGIFLRYS